MVDLFRECRERVTAEDAATFYGLEVKKHWARCPFHGDRNPSLHFFGGSFKCFSCNVAGSSIDFTQMYLGLESPLEAVRRLDKDFSLGLDTDSPQDTEATRKRQELDRRYREFEAWRQQTINELNACIRIANQAKPPFSPEQVEALKDKVTLEAWSDALMGTAEEQAEIYKMKEGVRLRIRKILSYSQTS